MGLLDSLLTIVVVAVVCYIVVMMYRRSFTLPPPQKSLGLPSSPFDDKMSEDQVRALHRLVTSTGGEQPDAAPSAQSPGLKQRSPGNGEYFM